MTATFINAPALQLAGIRHGFFGRAGGVSTGLFASLNMSTTTGDDPLHVAQNRAQVAAAFGASSEQMATVRQVHSARVATIAEAGDHGEADAMVTKQPNLLLGILTADCTPILLADPESRVIGAAHAGWKGATTGIIANTVERMRQLGADPARILAVIGPAISAASYEVGPDFAEALLRDHPDAASRIGKPAPGAREHFDLPGFVADRLRAAGVGTVHDLAICTYADPDRWFSHRRATHEGTTTGRQISLIGLV